jgi:hypothetical protein
VELRPSSTIGQQKRQGLTKSWEKIFQSKPMDPQRVKETTTKRYLQPKLTHKNVSNEAIGTNILTNIDSTELKTIWFHNINGMKDERNWAQIITTMRENHIDIFGFAETNKSGSTT